ncbi:hypothetical protein [Rummeliibacillus stabekisii]
MDRDHLIKFCYESAEEFCIEPKKYEELSDEQLKEDVEWFDYLWTK